MPDIAMCRNPTCEKKNECWRYMAMPNQPLDGKSIRKDDKCV